MTVRRKNPLKQGLRRDSGGSFRGSGKKGKKKESIKTRIETLCITHMQKHNGSFVRRKNPLKQGLRHPCDTALIIIWLARSKKKESIKTRIETMP